ncbi:TPA: hypoxanthine phosphoribosyltransferase [Candidatus Latescibacteria bacterium]|nr:hypoxanthine phosphoribosyltransferase [Candidatus Latescibacterota bacterium]
MSADDPTDILLSSDQIHDRIEALGLQISSDYTQSESLVLVGVLTGSFVFLADLIRRISIPTVVEMISVASYGDATKSSGHVRLLMDLQNDIEDCDVLIVEDIVDTGRTLNYLKQLLSQRKPGSLRVCTLLDKPSRREVEAVPDYVGFEIPDLFVVGFGLDHAQRYRNLSYIGVLE